MCAPRGAPFWSTRPFVPGSGSGWRLARALPVPGAGGEPCTSCRLPAPSGCSGAVPQVAAALCAAGTWRHFSARPVPESDAGGRQSRALPRPTHGGEPGTAWRSPQPPGGPGEVPQHCHAHTRSPVHTRDRLQAAKSTWLSTSFAHELDSRRLRGVSTSRCYLGALHAVIMRLARAPRVVTLVSGTATHSAPAVAVT